MNFHVGTSGRQVFGLLRERNAALCIAEADDGVEVPVVSTADWGYIRLRVGAYSRAELKAWVRRIRGQTWRDAFVFFKHEDEAKGPRFAQTFAEIVRGGRAR